MKHCTYCGKEYSDDVNACPLDGHPVQGDEASTPTLVQRKDTISPEEHKFWERMTLRQFAILLIRLQALVFLFNALLEITLLPRYLIRINPVGSNYILSSTIKLELFMLSIRIILFLAAAVLLIQRGEKILSWIVKDCVSKRDP